MTTNQRYAGINRRFDRRAALLVRLGFTYRAAVPGVAVFSRTRLGREHNVAAATLLHADREVWIDALATLLKRA